MHARPGFISIDCGIAANTSYSDQSTRGLRYVSDAGFVDAGDGLNALVRPPYDDPDMVERYRTVRYFPGGGAGARSCYTLRPVAPGGKYLVRTAYCYGNYDGLNELPVFDIHLGVNHWATINVTAVDDKYIHEAVVVSQADFLQVCACVLRAVACVCVPMLLDHLRTNVDYKITFHNLQIPSSNLR